MAKGKGNKVNRSGLAAVFGVSLPTVDAWVRAGCPFDQRGGVGGQQWEFDTADVARWREQRAADDAGGADVADEVALKKRRLKAETLAAELDLLERRNLVAPLEQMERVLTRAMAEVQSNLRGNLIARCASQLIGETDERKFKAVMLAEVDAVLESLADLDLTAEDTDVDNGEDDAD
jgi:phage terminase Nu1 subunit (DNA packaging protein)